MTYISYSLNYVLISDKFRMKVLILCILISFVLGEDVVLKIQKGNVRGKRLDGDMGTYYYAFRGIKYAQAPVEKLRFKVCKILQRCFSCILFC